MFLSFIIPVYNAEKYLKDCLESLLTQDINRDMYEIICVNDGSTDKSLEILKDYACKYPNINVIDQKNQGIGGARNAGFRRAKGEYIWFIDSDDFIEKNILGSLETRLKSAEYDCLEVGCYTFWNQLSADELKKKESGDLEINSRYYDIVMWNRIIRRTFCEKYQLSFKHEKLYYSEDSVYMFEFNMRNPVKGYLEETYYFYRRNPESMISIRTKESQEKRIISFIEAAKIMRDYYEQNVGNRQDAADILVSNLWAALFVVSKLPPKKEKEMLILLKEDKLFPYSKPKECTLKKSYQTNTNTWIGKCFDYLYIRLHTKSGYLLMRCWQKAEKIKNIIRRTK